MLYVVTFSSLRTLSNSWWVGIFSQKTQYRKSERKKEVEGSNILVDNVWRHFNEPSNFSSFDLSNFS